MDRQEMIKKIGEREIYEGVSMKNWKQPYKEYICKFRRLLIGLSLTEIGFRNAWGIADQCYAELKGWGFNGFIVEAQNKKMKSTKESV